jgi:hypothetical protein
MLSEQDKQALAQALERFQPWGASRLIGDPTSRASRTAQRWFRAMDAEYKELQPGDTLRSPLWLREYFQWGPTTWPLSWEEAMSGDTLDCGALAYLAYLSFTSQDVPAYQAQLLMRYPESMIDRWREQWLAAGASTAWILSPFVYHEAVFVERDGTLHLWDATDFTWLPAGFQNVTGGVVALRFRATNDTAPQQWGTHTLYPEQWRHLLQTCEPVP